MELQGWQDQTSNHSKEQAKPKSELSKLLEEKGLFRAYTPEWADPVNYPIEVMRQIKDDLDIKLKYDHSLGMRTEAQTNQLVNKYNSWKRSIVDMTRAYEIIAYPFCKDQQLRESIKKDLVDDAYYNGTENVHLNDEELELVGKLTAVRGLPFVPDKRIYEYSELSDCRKELATISFFSRTVFRS